MFGYKKKLAQKKYQEFLYLDGLARTASIFLDRAEIEPRMKLVAVGLKYAMERFADEFGKGEQYAEDCRVCCGLGVDEDEEYTSSTYGDYSPSNPWDAPGMSIRDFI